MSAFQSFGKISALLLFAHGAAGWMSLKVWSEDGVTGWSLIYVVEFSTVYLIHTEGQEWE